MADLSIPNGHLRAMVQASDLVRQVKSRLSVVGLTFDDPDVASFLQAECQNNGCNLSAQRLIQLAAAHAIEIHAAKSALQGDIKTLTLQASGSKTASSLLVIAKTWRQAAGLRPKVAKPNAVIVRRGQRRHKQASVVVSGICVCHEALALMANEESKLDRDNAGHKLALTDVATTYYKNRTTIEMALEQNVDGRLKRTWVKAPRDPEKPHDSYLENLPSLLAPNVTASGQAERGYSTHTLSAQSWRLALAEYFPHIVDTFRAVVDGRIYNITGVANDNGMATLLFLRRISS